jgi:hypothetical protein
MFMFGLLKLIVFAAGAVALYGLSTGVDLNELFTNSNEVLPAAKQVVSGIFTWVKNAALNS